MLKMKMRKAFVYRGWGSCTQLCAPKVWSWVDLNCELPLNLRPELFVPISCIAIDVLEVVSSEFYRFSIVVLLHRGCRKKEDFI